MYRKGVGWLVVFCLGFGGLLAASQVQHYILKAAQFLYKGR